MNYCDVALLVSLVLAPAAAIGSPGPGEPSSDSTNIELGLAVSGLHLPNSSQHGSCGYGGRFGYRWRDYVLFEGEYFHHWDRFGTHVHSLLLAGTRVGIRRGRLGAFIKLQPGMVRAVSDPHYTRFALAAGGVVEARVDSHVYVRLDLGYLIIWFGDARFGSALPPRPGTSRYPRFSIGIGFR